MKFPMSFRGPALFAAFLALTHPQVMAQSQDNVRLQFLSFPRDRDPEPVELLIQGGNPIKVDIPSNQFSQAYTVPRSSTWVVGETAPGPDGKPAFNEFGRAQALNSPSQLLLLIRKGQDYSDGFVILPMDNRVASFGGGRFLFMNATDKDIAGEVGGDKFVVRPGTHHIVRPRGETASNSFHAMFYFRSEEQARPFFSSRWPVSEKARNLVFFYGDPDTGNIRLHTIRDFSF